MSVTAYFSKLFYFVPKSLLVWSFLLFLLILSLPIIMAIVLCVVLKKFRLRIKPVSFLCYSYIRLVVPGTEFITFVITVRHLSISLHLSKPFITFRIRGLKVHIIQHLSLIHICRCRRYAVCRSRWSPYH
eukprot:TRINITY_DN13101_c0_g1_i3.p2 TRINITY_DN13101_c0_g1~~TRINITY_DN13101_c0_g1_i3.p2  ORF type:complete len:130 (-),score=30.84 TRINITY_DN13101_c0_g1_i3:9-398(-)